MRSDLLIGSFNDMFRHSCFDKHYSGRQTISHELQATSYELRDKSYQLSVNSYPLIATRYKLLASRDQH